MEDPKPSYQSRSSAPDSNNNAPITTATVYVSRQRVSSSNPTSLSHSTMSKTEGESMIAQEDCTIFPSQVAMAKSELSTNPEASQTIASAVNIPMEKLSTFEKLPTEIIEKIFLDEVNLSLPESSPIIGAKLSNKAILKKVAIHGFGPCWQRWYGIKTNEAWYWSVGARITQTGVHSVHSPRISKPGEGGDMKLQSDILGRPWASLSLLLESKETWIMEHAPYRVNISHLDPGKFDLVHDESSDDSESERQSLDVNSMGWHRESTHITEQQHLDEEFRRFAFYVKNFRFIHRGKPTRFNLQKYLGISIEIKRGVVLPNEILVDPWTEGKMKYLFWLMKSGARSTTDYPWRHGHRYESNEAHDPSWLAYRGWESAIKSGNLVVLNLLSLLIEERDWEKVIDYEKLLWVLENAGSNRLAVIEFVFHMTPSTKARTQFAEGIYGSVCEGRLDKEENEFRQRLINTCVEFRQFREGIRKLPA